MFLCALNVRMLWNETENIRQRENGQKFFWTSYGGLHQGYQIIFIVLEHVRKRDRDRDRERTASSKRLVSSNTSSNM